MSNTRLSIRVDLASGDRIGPGKIALLEAIAQTGSISAAARALGMSYRRAWLLVEAINEALREPAVSAATGGQHGGGAMLTPTGERIVSERRVSGPRAHHAQRCQSSQVSSGAAACGQLPGP
jgi:molybdate transport system regulatory protein